MIGMPGGRSGSLATALTIVFALQLVPEAQTRARQPAGKPPIQRAPAAASGDFEKLAARADQARQAERFEEAIEMYAKALKLRPRWEEGLWYLGTLLYERDHYADAANVLQALVGIQPRNGPAWALLGLSEFQIRLYDRSLINLQRARVLGLGDNAQLRNVTRYHAAILLTRFEKFEVAFETLREFAREHNDNPTVIEAIGINVLRLPFLPAEVPPDKREIVILAGRAAYDMAERRSSDASRGFQDLIRRYPDAPNVHYSYGVFLLAESADAALEEFKRELKISPTHVPAKLQIAFEYLKRGEFATALPYAEEAVKLDPKQFAARNALGRTLLETEDVAGAIRELEAGVKLAPDSPEMRFALARAYTRAGRKDDAARERAAFLRLDSAQRTLRQGSQAVGGAQPPPENKN